MLHSDPRYEDSVHDCVNCSNPIQPMLGSSTGWTHFSNRWQGIRCQNAVTGATPASDVLVAGKKLKFRIFVDVEVEIFDGINVKESNQIANTKNRIGRTCNSEAFRHVLADSLGVIVDDVRVLTPHWRD